MSRRRLHKDTRRFPIGRKCPASKEVQKPPAIPYSGKRDRDEDLPDERPTTIYQ